ncbi:MAG: DUF5684 domain-containing protein [Bacteroidales bacterium]
MISSIISLTISLITGICLWKINENNGEKGWTAFVPIYNLVVLIRIAGEKNMPSLPLLFIPIYK